MVLKSLRRKAAAASIAAPLAFGTLVVGAQPARADILGDVAAFVIPALTTVAAVGGGSAVAGAGAVCATGVGCVVLAAGALAVGGASLAWQHRDTIASWFDGDTDTSGQSTWQTQPTSNDDRVWQPDPDAPEVPSWAVGWESGRFAWNPVTKEIKWLGDYGGVLQTRWLFHCASGYWGDSQASFSASYGSTWVHDPCPGQAMDRMIIWIKPVAYGSIYDGDNSRVAFNWTSYVPGESVDRRAQVTCRQPDGTVYVLTGPEVHGAAGDASASVTVPACNEGDTGVKQEVQQHKAAHPWFGWTPQAIAGVDQDGLRSDYPECADGAPCVLRVVKSGGITCTVGAAGCVSWWPTRETSGVECHWGPYTVPIAQCLPLKNVYKSDPALDTNGFPSVEDSADPDPEATPTPTPTGTSDPTPTPTPTPTSTPTPTPEVPGGPDPEPDGDCGLGWGDLLNGSIVYKATGCALSWAFKPSAGAITAAKTSLNGAWAGTGLGTYVTGIVGVPTALGGVFGGIGGDCHGPSWTLPLANHDFVVRPLDSCEPPMSTMATVCKLLLSVSILVVGAKFVARPVLSSFGLGDSVK